LTDPVDQSSVLMQGWQGWDDYASFYDWENARTVGTRDVRFWIDAAARQRGRALELGCGTGRLLLPLARAGARVIGVDRSASMLAVLRRRARVRSPPVTRADITALPFASGVFRLVVAPYGMLQSVLSDALLARTLREAARVLMPGGLLGIDLVPDLPRWREYERHIRLTAARGPRGRPLRLVESVRQERSRGVTTFVQEFIEGRGREAVSTQFTLQFRTLPVQAVARRVSRAGLRVDRLLGGYDGRPYTESSDAWILLARKEP
jgi:SAM-dependent methyltransferase